MCNENLDLVQLLSNCPKGTKLWCPLFGEVVFERVEKGSSLPIICAKTNQVGCARFTSTGRYYSAFPEAECVLFPSKDNRDWSTFCAYKDGDFLANNDGRAFIFRGKLNEHGYPMAYGGVDTFDDFVECEDNKVWAGTPFRFATTDEIHILQTKMKEAGYMWNADQKKLEKDLPVDTLVAVCDSFHEGIYFHSMLIRRYAGKQECFNGNGGNDFHKETVSWHHIIPLNELTVNEEGIVELYKVRDYGTSGKYA